MEIISKSYLSLKVSTTKDNILCGWHTSALKSGIGQVGYVAAFTLTGLGVLTARRISNVGREVEDIMDGSGEFDDG